MLISSVIFLLTPQLSMTIIGLCISTAFDASPIVDIHGRCHKKCYTGNEMNTALLHIAIKSANSTFSLVR